MPYLTNQIGGLTFITVEGNIDLRSEQLETFARIGRDGVIARKTGSRGVPFRLQTVSYVTNHTAAKTLNETLKALVGDQPLTIIQHSVNYGDFLLLRVRQVDKRAMINCTLGSEFQVRVVHEWEFLG